MVAELTIFVPSAFDLVRSSGSSKEEVIRKSPGLPRVHGITAKHYATGEMQFITFYSEKKTNSASEVQFTKVASKRSG